MTNDNAARNRARVNFVALWKTGFVKPATDWKAGTGIPYTDEAAKADTTDPLWGCDKIELSDETGAHVTCTCVIGDLTPKNLTWKLLEKRASEFFKAGPDAASRTLKYIEAVFPDQCAAIKNKSPIEAALLELGFKQSEVAEGSRVVLIPSSPEDNGCLLTSEDLQSTRYAKCRDGLGLFPIMVDVSSEHVVIQACQIVGKEHREKDARIKDGGLIWYTQAFTDRDEALAFIKYANDEWKGPLYGPLFPPP